MIPGTVQVLGPIAPTAVGDTYASHLEEYGEGGRRTVEDAAERLAIPAERRKKGMEVKQWDTKVVYELEADLTTWTPVTGGIDPADVMLKCFHPSTEILTKAGWKPVEKVLLDDLVMTLNPTGSVLEYQKPINLFEYKFTGDLIGRKTKQLDYLVTPNHKFYVKKWLSGGTPYKIWSDASVWETAEQIKGKIRSFPLTGKWKGVRIDKRFGIDGDLYIKFMAWYLSEGHTQKNRVTVSQVTKRDLVSEVVNSVAKSLGVKVVVYHGIDFGFCHKELALFTKTFGTSKLKFIPDEIKNATIDQIRLFIDTYTLGDGFESVITTVSKQMADDLQELCLKAGWWASVVNDGPTSGFGSLNDLYRINVNRNNKSGATQKKHNYAISYEGPVFCIEVPNHILYTRLNGRAVFSGNSNYDPNNDLVVNNAALLAGETAAAIRDRALHTGAQAISTVTGLQAALDAKIETSEVGVANGLVPTNGSNKIDNAYLNFTLPLDPVIAWNPVTNTPAISDAGGAAGEIYIVYDSGNPTARDLGSGSKNWSDGDAAIFDSGTSAFVRVGGYAVGVIDVTTDAGTQSGAVVIDDTTHIAPSTDRNYVTDDQLAAIPAGADGSDKLIKNSELISALLLVSSSVNIYPELFANNETLGDGTARTLDSLGYNAGTAAAAWPRTDALRTIDVNTWTIDDVSWQEMLYFMLQQGAQYSITPSGKGYVFAVGVLLPKDQIAVPLETRSLRYTFDLRNSRISSVNNIILFDRYPADQAEAADYRLDYAYDFINGMMVGNDSSVAGDCAIRLGGTNHSTIRNMEFYKFGLPLDLQFCLNMDIQNVKLMSYGLYGVRAGDGLWSGAGINISQTNVFTTHKLRCVNDALKTSAIAGVYLTGNQNTELNFNTFEGGGTPEHLILYDNLEATTTKYNLNIKGAYIETVGASRAGIRFRSNSGTCILDGFSAQGNSTDMPVLFEAETIGAPAASPLFIKIMDQPDFNFGWKFRQNAVQKWRVTDVKLNDMTNFAAATNWDTGIVGSTIPTSDYYAYLRPIA